jgi:anion transporter
LSKRLIPAFTVLLCVAAAVIYFLPPPAGATTSTMHAAALIVLTAGLWALGALPEHITALLFFMLAVVLAIAPPEIVFSGFASATMWLVLGGLFIAEAVRTTGLGRRFADVLFGRFTRTYAGLVAEVAIAGTVLAFFMPATVGRVLLLIPIVISLAERVGFRRGSSGFNGLCMIAIIISYQSGIGMLPANAPNLVLAGAAEALYGVHFIYAEWMWVMFPVLCLLKGMVLIALTCWLFPARMEPQSAPPPPAPMSAEEWRLAVILVIALVLWATDFLHGIRAGWIALAAAVACLLPRIGMLSGEAFNEVRLGAFFYVGAAIGVGAVVNESGLGELLGRALLGSFNIQQGADFTNFMGFSLFATVVGLVTTNPAQPAVVAPLAQQFAEAAGWPLNTALMTMAVGFSTMLLPYQVPPAVVGISTAGMSMRTVLRLVLPLAAVSVVVLLPINYLWWRAIGYFH